MMDEQRENNKRAPMELKTQIRQLRDEIIVMRERRQPREAVWTSSRANEHFIPLCKIELRQKFALRDEGSAAKVDLGPNNEFMILAAGARAHGSLSFFDTDKNVRNQYVQLENSWMLTAAIERSVGNFAMVGGLENKVQVYELSNYDQDGQPGPMLNLEGHEGSVNDVCFGFNSSRQIISASGDSSLKLWDTDTSKCVSVFAGHTSDVFVCCASPNNEDIFLSGAGDFTARYWDKRDNVSSGNNQGHSKVESQYTFDTQSRDVNSIDFFPNGDAFATAMNNSLVYLYDVKASTRILCFKSPQTYERFEAEEVKFSVSGRLLFVRYRTGMVLVYDVAGPTRDDARHGPTIENSHHTLLNAGVKSMTVGVEGSCFGIGIDTNNPEKNDAVGILYWPGKKHY